MCGVRNMTYLVILISMILFASSREIHRNSKILSHTEDNDTIVVENPELSPNTINPRQYGAIQAGEGEDDDDNGYDLETIFKAFLESAAIVEKLTADLEDEEGRDEMGTKKISIFPQFNPAQILEPIGNKFSEISEAFSRPNFGFSLPNPGHIWHKIKEAGANFLNGANSAIFGSDSHLSGDYPFPYRNQNGRNLREDLENYEGSVLEQAMKTLAYWREKLLNYKENAFNSSQVNRAPINNPYLFPYYPGFGKIKEEKVNTTIN